MDKGAESSLRVIVLDSGYPCLINGMLTTFLYACDVYDVSHGHYVWNFHDVNDDLPVNDTNYVNDKLNYIHI